MGRLPMSQVTAAPYCFERHRESTVYLFAPVRVPSAAGEQKMTDPLSLPQAYPSYPPRPPSRAAGMLAVVFLGAVAGTAGFLASRLLSRGTPAAARDGGRGGYEG